MDRSAGASACFSARDSITRKSVRFGLAAIGAVNSRARTQSLAAEVLAGLTEGCTRSNRTFLVNSPNATLFEGRDPTTG